MKRKALLFFAAGAALALVSCTSDPAYNTIGGGMGGAATGAAIGCIVTIPVGCAPGAALGAIVGGGVGAAGGLASTNQYGPPPGAWPQFAPQVYNAPPLQVTPDYRAPPPQAYAPPPPPQPYGVPTQLTPPPNYYGAP